MVNSVTDGGDAVLEGEAPEFQVPYQLVMMLSLVRNNFMMVVWIHGHQNYDETALQVMTDLVYILFLHLVLKHKTWFSIMNLLGNAQFNIGLVSNDQDGMILLADINGGFMTLIIQYILVIVIL